MGSIRRRSRFRAGVSGDDFVKILRLPCVQRNKNKSRPIIFVDPSATSNRRERRSSHAPGVWRACSRLLWDPCAPRISASSIGALSRLLLLFVVREDSGQAANGGAARHSGDAGSRIFCSFRARSRSIIPLLCTKCPVRAASRVSYFVWTDAVKSSDVASRVSSQARCSRLRRRMICRSGAGALRQLCRICSNAQIDVVKPIRQIKE